MKCYYGKRDDGDDDEKYFAKVIEPYTCCDPTLQVYDKEKQLKNIIVAKYCQCSLVCGGAYKKLLQTKFGIYNKETKDFSEDNTDGSITKHARNIMMGFGDADSFEIKFPKDSSAEERLTLICATLMIDYLHFELSGA
jgi:hypothetical protein